MVKFRAHCKCTILWNRFPVMLSTFCQTVLFFVMTENNAFNVHEPFLETPVASGYIAYKNIKGNYIGGGFLCVNY